MKAQQLRKEVKGFNGSGYIKDVIHHNAAYEQLKAVSDAINKNGLDVSRKDLETLYKGQFSTESLMELTKKHYQSVDDKTMRAVFFRA